MDRRNLEGEVEILIVEVFRESNGETSWLVEERG